MEVLKLIIAVDLGNYNIKTCEGIIFESRYQEVEKEDSSRATTTVKRPYRHKSEECRGRMNQLLIDKDQEHAGK